MDNVVREFASAYVLREERAYESLVAQIAERGGMDQATARKVFETLRKVKALKYDAYNGVWSVKHGGFLDRAVLRRAAGLEGREMTHPCSTAAKRATLARQIETLAARIGVECEREEHDRAVYLTLSSGGYAVSMHLEPLRGCSAFMGHWHTRYTGDKPFPESLQDPRPGYPADFPCQSLNTITFGKATTHCAGFAEFLAAIERGFRHLRACAAYAPASDERGTLTNLTV